MHAEPNRANEMLAAKSADLALGLDDAVALVNAWLRDIGIGG